MTLKKLLEQILEGITQLNARAAAGEDVSAQIAQLQSTKTQVEAQIAEKGPDAVVETPAGAQPTDTLSPEQELAQLRERERQREERDAADRQVQRILEAAAADEAQRQERIDTYVEQSLQRQLPSVLGASGVHDAAMTALRTSRGASRFANENASSEALQALAAGGGLIVADGSRIEVGEHKGAKEIREKKSLSGYMGMILKANQGGFGLSEAERLFLAECQSKAMSEGTDTAGGFFVHPEWMPDILALLRAQAVVRKAGPRVVPFNKLMNQTSISSGATAYYTAENAHIQKSEPTLAEAPLLTPKNLTGLVPVSNYLLNDAPEADDMVRGDLVEVMALREDLSFLQGTGAGGEPTGMKNMSGRTANPVALGANGGYLTQPQTRAIRNITRTFNSQNPRWVWFWPPQFLNHLEGLTDADGRYLADSAILRINDDGQSGVYDTVPFFTTTQIPVNLTSGVNSDTTYLILVDINNLVIGENMALELAVSTEASYTPDGGTTWISAFQATQTLFRATLRHDIAHRRPNHVVVETGVRV